MDENPYGSSAWTESAPPMEPVVTVGQWLRLYLWALLALIPVVGILALIVVYIVKLASASTPLNIRNFLKAYGVYFLITFGVSIFAFVALAVIAARGMNALSGF